MEKESFKKYVIKMFSAMPCSEAFLQNEVCLVTALGIITGRFSLKHIPESESSGSLSEKTFHTQMFDEIFLNYCENYNIEPSSLSGNDGAIVLNDVKILNNGVIAEMNELVVFFDQIIAISLGSQNLDQ